MKLKEQELDFLFELSSLAEHKPRKEKHYVEQAS